MMMHLGDIRRRKINPEYTEYMKLKFYERKWYRTLHGKPKKYLDEVKKKH